VVILANARAVRVLDLGEITIMRIGMIVLAIVVAAAIAQTTTAEQRLPWAFNAPAADGYSIGLNSVVPTPGTPLIAGTKVNFKLLLSYKMSIASHGKVVLVFQDDKNNRVESAMAQVSHEVPAGEGTVALEQTITVPSKAKELRLFIPLVPDGISQTTGEVTLRYPIAKAK
jgi:hypothetical protein